MSDDTPVRFTARPDLGSIDSLRTADTTEAHIGGIYSGGQTNELNADSNRQASGTAGCLGNFEARTQGGTRVNSISQLGPTDIVTIMVEGRPMEMEAQAARDYGLLRRDGSGATRAATEAEQAQQHDQ